MQHYRSVIYQLSIIALVVATQVVDRLWLRIGALLIATVLLNWVQNRAYRQREAIIRRQAEISTAQRIISAVDSQSLQ